MARSNKKDVRRPEDWFPPVPYNTATIAGMDAAIAAAVAASFPIPESSVTGLVSDLASKLNSSVAGAFGLTLLGEATLAAAKISLAYTKADVGLSSVDNTADAAKNVLSATKLTTARNINGVAFDGTGDITIATGGSGTVTTLSVVTANGVSGSVANPTTTPAITITLGAITPTSVVASGNITGANLSGTNTGDQTITLTGDVTGSGTGSFAATLAATAVAAGTYGDGTHVGRFTVDAKGRLTAASSVAITGTSSSVTIVQQKSFIGDSAATATLTLASAPTAGNLIVAIGTYWTTAMVVNQPWSTLLKSAVGSFSGNVILARVAAGGETTSLSSPMSNPSTYAVTIFELAGALPIPTMSFDNLSQSTATSYTLHLGSGKDGSVVLGITSTEVDNTAPSGISGGPSLGTTVTGTTTNASPREITPFTQTGVAAATGVTPVVTYAGSKRRYAIGICFPPL